jgi:alpha,alpha-trehalase
MQRRTTAFAVIFALAVLSLTSLAEPPVKVRVAVEPTIERLLAAQDTDHDGLITFADSGSRLFELRTVNNASLLVEGTYSLGNLLQELGAARITGSPEIDISSSTLFQNPAAHVSYMIRGRYWNWLTRTVDAAGLARIVEDPKLAGQPARVYVPYGDPKAFAYYTDVANKQPELKLEVIRLPEHITPQFVRSINTKPGILSLAMQEHATAPGGIIGAPFVVPGGRFNEMYGWDSYFIALGLLEDDRVDLARSMVDNFVYQIEHYGKILNANRTYYLTRSQPPFLTSMALAVYQKLPHDDESRAWLARALRAAIREYESVWTVAPRLTETGLSRYFGTGLGLPPEVEPGHFAPLIRPLAAKASLSEAEFERQFTDGTLPSPELDALLLHDRAMRESGHDTSYRLLGRAADLNTVALNALLYKYEKDLESTIKAEFGGRLDLGNGKSSESELWAGRAARRRETMMKLMWDDRRALFFDYDFVNSRQTADVSATTLYPLWAGMMEQKNAQRLARAALAALEEPGGIVAGTEDSRGALGADRPPRQWDYPFGWAPHQIIAWRALERAGMPDEARRLAYRWTYMIAMNAARSNGAIVEKYDVVQRSIDASAEYGNVGARFRLVPEGGFGWTNASYEIGIGMLTEPERESLNRLVPPEWLFKISQP